MEMGRPSRFAAVYILGHSVCGNDYDDMDLKREDELSPEDTPEGVVDTYKHVVSIFKLRPVQILCMILFTSKIAFSG